MWSHFQANPRAWFRSFVQSSWVAFFLFSLKWCISFLRKHRDFQPLIRADFVPSICDIFALLRDPQVYIPCCVVIQSLTSSQKWSVKTRAFKTFSRYKKSVWSPAAAKVGNIGKWATNQVYSRVRMQVLDIESKRLARYNSVLGEHTQTPMRCQSQRADTDWFLRHSTALCFWHEYQQKTWLRIKLYPSISSQRELQHVLMIVKCGNWREFLFIPRVLFFKFPHCAYVYSTKTPVTLRFQTHVDYKRQL